MTSHSHSTREQLLKNLVEDQSSPWRNPSLPKILSFGFLVSVLSSSLILSILHLRANLDVTLAHWTFAFTLTLLVMASLSAALLALRSGVPGNPLPQWGISLFWVGMGLVILPLVFSVAQEQASKAVNIGVFAYSAGLKCALNVGLFSLVPAASFLYVLRSRFAAVAPERTGRWIGVASGGLGAATLAWHCPVNEGTHILIWHLLPILMLGWLISRVSRSILRF